MGQVSLSKEEQTYRRRIQVLDQVITIQMILMLSKSKVLPSFLKARLT